MIPKIPSLLAISDLKRLQTPLAEWLDQLLAVGVDALQIREKDLTDRELFALARGVREILDHQLAVRTRQIGFKLLINGRIDIALASGADGVHLPAGGLPVESLRRRFGPDWVLGVSTHRLDEVTAAQRQGADYVTFGPIYPTPSKARFGPPPGLVGLRQASRLGVSVVGLGGISAQRVDAVRECGASGVAGIRMFQDPAQLSLLAARGSG